MELQKRKRTRLEVPVECLGVLRDIQTSLGLDSLQAAQNYFYRNFARYALEHATLPPETVGQMKLMSGNINLTSVRTSHEVKPEPTPEPTNDTDGLQAFQDALNSFG